MLKVACFVLLAGILSACATSAVFDDDSGTDPMMMMMGSDSGTCSSMCSGMCADLKTDNANCGKCGTACPSGATCVQSVCQCGMSASKCGTSCVDLKTDLANCGKCGTVCGGADAGPIMGGGMWTCTNGACAVTCPMGKTECNGACVDTKTDPDNCGMCGTTCNVQTEQCMESMCCTTGQKVCSMMCTSVQSDAMNCGMCGNVCPQQTPQCSAGMCIAGPIFNSLTGNQSSTARGASDSCGTQLSVNQNVTIHGIAVSNAMNANGNIKFMVWTHPNHVLVYVSSPKAFSSGAQAWRQSDSFNYTLLSGQSYDIGGITDVAATWYFDTTPENKAPFTSMSTNPNWTNYASPTSGGHAAADCGIQLF